MQIQSPNIESVVSDFCFRSRAYVASFDPLKVLRVFCKLLPGGIKRIIQYCVSPTNKTEWISLRGELTQSRERERKNIDRKDNKTYKRKISIWHPFNCYWCTESIYASGAHLRRLPNDSFVPTFREISLIKPSLNLRIFLRCFSSALWRWHFIASTVHAPMPLMGPLLSGDGKYF